jgi:hypothetical protein
MQTPALYKTQTRMKNGEVLFGFTRSPERSRAFTTPHNFSRIVAATNDDLRLDSRHAVEMYLPNNWARRLARIFFTGARLRRILRRV